MDDVRIDVLMCTLTVAVLKHCHPFGRNTQRAFHELALSEKKLSSNTWCGIKL